jgi:predicted nucleotide-binding protein
MSAQSTAHENEKEQLETFLKRIPGLSDVAQNHTELVAHLGYFLEEERGETDLTPKKFRRCYDAAAIPTPANIADTVRKSQAFIRTGSGTRLHRDVRARIQASLAAPPGAKPSTSKPIANEIPHDKSRKVVVIHGRDSTIRENMFQFLRSLELSPIEWGTAVQSTGCGAPYTGEVVDALFSNAQAIVVILTPDEHVELKPELQSEDHADNSGWQPRPNVYIETGMALARDEAHTILVQIGFIRQASDLIGRNHIHFDGSPTHRHDLAERLRTAGCAISTSGSDWLRVGNFEISPQVPKEGKRKTR